MGKAYRPINSKYIHSDSIRIKNQTLSNYLACRNTFTMYLQGYTTLPKYYHLATLPKNDTGNGSTLRITGTIGGYESYTKAIVDILISNRDSIKSYSTHTGSSGAFKYAIFECYQDDAGAVRIYYKAIAKYTGGVNLEVVGNAMSEPVCSTTETTPIGTLVHTINSTNSRPLLTMYDDIQTMKSDIQTLSSNSHNHNERYVSGDTVKTTNIATVTFTGSYQSAFLAIIVVSCASGSAEDTGLVIYKLRSNEASNKIAYGVEVTNTAKASITVSGSTATLRVSQTVQWRYLRLACLAKSDNIVLI